MATVCQVSTVVVCAYTLWLYRSHKICIFMFPTISGEQNNACIGVRPDPSLFVKGVACETKPD